MALVPPIAFMTSRIFSSFAGFTTSFASRRPAVIKAARWPSTVDRDSPLSLAISWILILCLKRSKVTSYELPGDRLDDVRVFSFFGARRWTLLLRLFFLQ